MGKAIIGYDIGKYNEFGKKIDRFRKHLKKEKIKFKEKRLGPMEMSEIKTTGKDILGRYYSLPKYNFQYAIEFKW